MKLQVKRCFDRRLLDGVSHSVTSFFFKFSYFACLQYILNTCQRTINNKIQNKDQYAKFT